VDVPIVSSPASTADDADMFAMDDTIDYRLFETWIQAFDTV